MRFASRSGEVTPEEGLEIAYKLLEGGRPGEAAMVFLAYADQENELGVVSESEYSALADHLKELMANVALYRMIVDRQLQPVLTDDLKPAYKPSPWFDEDYSPS
jgi:hypothetical protein